ncbi:MAG TPA: hypothetical protein VK968_03495, partial [Roseimicrobium sp.]|nr:hypothetical protein [Roseimicrobium sp.]
TESTDCPASTPADISWNSIAPDSNHIRIEGTDHDRLLSDAELFMMTEQTVTGIFGKRLADRVQIHAAAVADPRGNGWIIPGPSGTGKSSLTLSLMLQGWSWLSDELTLLGEEDPESILSFPRNFNVKQVSFPLFPETAGKPSTVELYSAGRKSRIRFFDPLEIAPGSAAARAPIRGMIVAKWNPDPKSARIRMAPGVNAAQSVLGEGVKLHPWAFGTLVRLSRDLPVVEVTYTNARDTGKLVEVLGKLS